MPIITPAALTALMTGYRNDFQSGMTMAAPQWQEVAMLVPSTTKSNTYGWLGQFPQFREWVGDRVIKSMEAHGHTIVNKHWESTVGVNRDDIEDDNLGVYSPLFQEMGRASAAHPDEIVYPLLAAGFSTLCYDGQNFFDTDHPVNAEVDGSGADSSVANAVIDGAYVGSPWFLMDDTRAVKPIIFQQRKKPVFTSMTKLDDEQVFTANEFRFGVDCRDNAGFALWQLMYGAQQDLTYDNLWAAYSAMRAFKADGGRPLGIRPSKLVVSVDKEKAALELIENKTRANGEDNALYKKFKVVVADFL